METVTLIEPRDLSKEISEKKELIQMTDGGNGSDDGDSTYGENGCHNNAMTDGGNGSYDLTVKMLQDKISTLDGRLRIVEESIQNPKKLLDPSKFITKSSMIEMIREAISQGSHSYGVSKKFIKKVLAEQNNIDMNRYYSKKLNFLLQSGIDSGALLFDSSHQLYKLS